MKTEYKVRRLFTVLILTFAIASLSAVSLSDVWAMTSPAPAVSASSIPAGGPITLTLTGATDGSSFAAPHEGTIYVVEHQVPPKLIGAATFNAAPGGCTVAFGGGVGRIWQLTDVAGPTRTNLGIPALLDTLSVTFSAANAPNPQFTGTPATLSPAGPYTWTEITGNLPAAPDTLTVGPNWSFFVCGVESTAPPNPVLQGAQYSLSQSFSVVEPVGGTILPLDTTALLIAGTFTNAVWLIPMAGAVAAGAVGMYKLRRK